MNLRRSAAALAAATVLGMAAVPAASADTPLPPGLYGTGDPTYDGVWRQSYALLALDTAGVKPADSAVAWLTGQQCADGGFPSYRADPAKACDAKTEDTNATGIAVQALTALGGKDAIVKKATDWLTSVRNKDGGWSYNPGGASDPNSTGVVIGAQSAVREASDSLKAFQFGCDAKAADRGAFGYPMNGKLTVNAKATADAVRGAHGAGFVVAPSTTNVVATAPDCASPDAYKKLDADGAASAGGAYLTTQLTAGGGHLTAVTPGADKPTPDYGTTADAVIALAAIHQRDTAKTSYDWLAKNSATWSKGNPAALSQLILAAHATGNDPRSAGGADLVQQLTNLGPKPAAVASASPSPSDKTEKKDDKSSSATWWIVGVFFVASIGVGFLVSGRKKKQG
ncbi:prenyltransferase/squalene oxidase repeat-containing protein [Streptomyces sp. RKAG337]|uniref:prenyltransferase/squalene oxidase repeat-containing protein n=1 Tax=Streptomyces sp. RKAG337 TaxID=2893404 RepID=UPI0020344D51|nr:prenyltransferase/squalene oxidase repeat-containing protein [Streptomyces sp. RKAG337]MCM2428646.1 terpene cyclase/mutase family protein [Streptomyces sp. RKAG337]